MNWIIQGDYNEHEELSNRAELSECEEYRLEELSANINYYEKTYGGK